MQLWDRAAVWPWVIVAILLGTVAMYLFPFGLIMLGAALSVGGYVGLRLNTDPRVKAFAAGTLAGGVACFITLAFIMLFVLGRQ